jgi:hypothetical protein
LVESAQLCGTHGFGQGKNSYFYTTSANQDPVNACGTHCIADGKYLSFAIDGSACHPFSVAV